MHRARERVETCRARRRLARAPTARGSAQTRRSAVMRAKCSLYGTMRGCVLRELTIVEALVEAQLDGADMGELLGVCTDVAN